MVVKIPAVGYIPAGINRYMLVVQECLQNLRYFSVPMLDYAICRAEFCTVENYVSARKNNAVMADTGRGFVFRVQFYVFRPCRCRNIRPEQRVCGSA